jgi:hypothetical protein
MNSIIIDVIAICGLGVVFYEMITTHMQHQRVRSEHMLALKRADQMGQWRAAGKMLGYFKLDHASLEHAGVEGRREVYAGVSGLL